jgi:hypothetical protein
MERKGFGEDLPDEPRSRDFVHKGANRVYAGILRMPFPEPGHPRLNILQAADPTKPDLMTVLVDRNGVDQPFIQVDTHETKDRILVGSNNTTVAGRSATIDLTPGAGAGGGFRTAVIDTRDGEHDGPQIRPLLHPDGKTIYAAFYGWRSIDDISDTRLSAKADVVVVRDDAGAAGAAPFTALTEPGDGRAGRIVARVTVPFVNENQPDFGQERVGGDLSIAVDPRPGSAATVYLAYCDGTVGGDYTLHLIRSTDRGATWSGDLKTLAKAKNPALAVNPDGKAALLYQQLSGTGSAQRWETILESSTDEFATTRKLVLATVPALSPPAHGRRPYNGDYLYMMAVGRDFYGIFSANNTPDPAHFPAARPTYQRNADFTAKALLGSDNATKVDPSIDPFFFRVSDAP